MGEHGGNGNESSGDADAFKRIFEDYFLKDSRLPQKAQRYLPLAFQCLSVYRGDWSTYLKRISAEMDASKDETYRAQCRQRLEDIVNVLVPLEEQLRARELKGHDGARILSAWRFYEEFSRDTPVDGVPNRTIEQYFSGEAG